MRVLALNYYFFFFAGLGMLYLLLFLIAMAVRSLSYIAGEAYFGSFRGFDPRRVGNGNIEKYWL